MARPATPPNLMNVEKCIAALFAKITHDNGYYTDGPLIVRGKDPRAFVKDQEYLRRLSAISFKPRRRRRDPEVTGTRIGWLMQYDIWAMRTLSKDEDADGVVLNDIETEIIDDMWRVMDRDQSLITVAGEIGITPPPHIIDLKATDFVSSSLALYPNVLIQGQMTFKYRERRDSIP